MTQEEIKNIQFPFYYKENGQGLLCCVANDVDLYTVWERGFMHFTIAIISLEANPGGIIPITKAEFDAEFAKYKKYITTIEYQMKIQIEAGDTSHPFKTTVYSPTEENFTGNV
jgi:hypothetical protein